MTEQDVEPIKRYIKVKQLALAEDIRMMALVYGAKMPMFSESMVTDMDKQSIKIEIELHLNGQ